MKRIDGDQRVALGFGAVADLLAKAKADLRAGSAVGAMEHVAKAENVLNAALADLEIVTSVPWTAIVAAPLGQLQ